MFTMQLAEIDDSNAVHIHVVRESARKMIEEIIAERMGERYFSGKTQLIRASAGLPP